MRGKFLLVNAIRAAARRAGQPAGSLTIEQGMEGKQFRATSCKEHQVDALASEGEERRGKLR